MAPDVVADIGNTRIKWGRCAGGALAEVVSLPPDDVPAWQKQLDAWRDLGLRSWVLAGVHPVRCLQLAEWLRGRGLAVQTLGPPAGLPLEVRLEKPGQVGIDRLLNAVAVNGRRQSGCPAAVVDAGSAVTVDYVDAGGAFRGGAILPGLRLMARVLNDHTALLPLVEVSAPAELPGASTTTAIQAGVFWAVAGGIDAILGRLRGLAAGKMEVYFTGGDAGALTQHLQAPVVVWPEMTLEGIRRSAQSLPAGGAG